MHTPSIIKQTNYKIITEKLFWLYTYTLICILNQYIISHWQAEVSKLNYFYALQVTISELYLIFNFVHGHVSPSWFIW